MSTLFRPSLCRVSGTSRIISSNSLHLAALSLLLILPLSIFNIIHALIQPPSTSPFNPHQIIPKLLYAFALLIFNIFFVSSVSHSIFHAFHRNPIKISSSLKSILSSFPPLLATKLSYFVIIVAIFIAFGFCIGVVFFGMILVGIANNPTTKPFIMAVAMILFVSLYVYGVYLWVEWCLIGAVVVVESKYGFAPLKRSSTLLKGMRRAAFVITVLPAVMQGVISWRVSALAGEARTSGGVAIQMAVCVVLSTVVALFGLAANMVLFIHCKAVNGESDAMKMKQIYVQLPRDAVDEG